MIPDALIIITRHSDFRGGLERLEWEWQGGKVVTMQLGDLHEAGITDRLDIGQVVNIGPFRLRVLDYDPPRRAYTFCRTGFKGTIKYSLYRTTKGLDFCYRRLIITAAVWGLATYHDYKVPTWEDIYILNAIVDKLKRAK